MRNAPLYSEIPRRTRPGGGENLVSRDRLEPEDLLRGMEHVTDLRADIRGCLEHVEQGVELGCSQLSTAGTGDDGVGCRSRDRRERAALPLEGEVHRAVTGRVGRGHGAR